jgi:hypothetical protein
MLLNIKEYFNILKKSCERNQDNSAGTVMGQASVQFLEGTGGFSSFYNIQIDPGAYPASYDNG